jgi:hypothetical protein
MPSKGSIFIVGIQCTRAKEIKWLKCLRCSNREEEKEAPAPPYIAERGQGYKKW